MPRRLDAPLLLAHSSHPLMIYADYNATTPCDRQIAERMLEVHCDSFANPSNRTSLAGRNARGLIDTARQQLATAVGAHPDEFIFTSGATEASNTIIYGVMQRLMATRPRILLSSIEHPAVQMPVDYCVQSGAEGLSIKGDRQGRLDLAQLQQALSEKPTALVCVMAANNETGVLQDIPEVVRISHAAGALVFSDMTQLLGKAPIDLHHSGVDFACFSAHKCYGPKGVGAFYKRRGLALSPLLRGGGQEAGLRSGTENVAGIMGFGMAADLASREGQQRQSHLRGLTELLENQLRSQLPGVIIHSSEAERMPGTSMCSLPGLRGKWLSQLPGIIASSGSACASLQGKASHVLLEMGVDEKTALHSVRISLGKSTTEAEVHKIAAQMCAGAQKLLQS
ncbi:cysteine desulfurase family protein [Kiritimatiellota bacterium B12222]|nr:cysteine desulfurase family protein [Kiritimatiellota bacterium B12222]